MITVRAPGEQFGVEFFQASFSAKDIDRLVKSRSSAMRRRGSTTKAKRANRPRELEMLEKRIGESEAAYQRPVIRRKIDELVAYYRDCKEAGTLPPSRRVIITSEKRFTFTPWRAQHDWAPPDSEEHGVLRVLDGQHRAPGAARLTQAGENLGIECRGALRPARRGAIRRVFVTINAKQRG